MNKKLAFALIKTELFHANIGSIEEVDLIAESIVETRRNLPQTVYAAIEYAQDYVAKIKQNNEEGPNWF